MKITRNTTVGQLKDAIVANTPLVQDKDLLDRIAYTAKAEEEGKKVSKKDLVDLVKAIIEHLGDKFVEPTPVEVVEETPAEDTEVVAENSVKKPSKLKKGVKEEVSEEVKEEQSEEDTKEEKVDTKKSAKKNAGKEVGNSVVSVLESKETGDFNVQSFAEEFTLEDGDKTTKYVRADDITSMGDLLNEDLDKVVFAFYWNKKQLKKFGYMNNVDSIVTPKEFPNDLDLASCMWVSEDNIVTHVISLYTEAGYTLTPADFDSVNGVRYMKDIEFQIYRVVDEQ